MVNSININILYIVDGLPAGGVERQIVELLRGLKSFDSITTTLCSLSKGGARELEARRLSDQTIDSDGASNAGLSLLIRFPFLLRKLFVSVGEKKHPDIIHTFGCFSDIAGVVLSKRFDIPLINGSIRAARPRLNYRDRVSKLTFSYATSIVANSEAGLRSFGMNKQGIVIHNGVDLARFENIESAAIDGSPLLCMVGNFTDKKDQAGLIRCLTKLGDEFENLKLILVGRGKNVQFCRDLSTSLQCDDRILFIENCDSPEPYIASSDLCFLLSNTEIHGEGISNSIIEYMALAKPVIASDCGGNYEIIDDGKTGFLVHNSDSSTIVELTKQLLADQALAKEMGRKGRTKIIQSFSIEKMVSAYIDLYEEVLS